VSYRRGRVEKFGEGLDRCHQTWTRHRDRLAGAGRTSRTNGSPDARTDPGPAASHPGDGARRLERDGEEWIDGEATRWTDRIVFVEFWDRRLATIGGMGQAQRCAPVLVSFAMNVWQRRRCVSGSGEWFLLICRPAGNGCGSLELLAKTPDTHLTP
jgi:hypothetical protein